MDSQAGVLASLVQQAGRDGKDLPPGSCQLDASGSVGVERALPPVPAPAVHLQPDFGLGPGQVKPADHLAPEPHLVLPHRRGQAVRQEDTDDSGLSHALRQDTGGPGLKRSSQGSRAGSGSAIGLHVTGQAIERHQTTAQRIVHHFLQHPCRHLSGQVHEGPPWSGKGERAQPADVGQLKMAAAMDPGQAAGGDRGPWCRDSDLHWPPSQASQAVKHAGRPVGGNRIRASHKAGSQHLLLPRHGGPGQAVQTLAHLDPTTSSQASFDHGPSPAEPLGLGPGHQPQLTAGEDGHAPVLALFRQRHYIKIHEQQTAAKEACVIWRVEPAQITHTLHGAAPGRTFASPGAL